MEILTAPAQMRSAIRKLFSDGKDQRIVAVAFVGADALSFLPANKGVVVYCWPQPGGTNPAGIEALVDAGVTVHFVERLHAKIYWSRDHGSLIGSANLTANALGESGLREVAVCLPPGLFDIRPFIRSLKIIDDFDGKLKWLHQAHIRFLQRNPNWKVPPAPAGRALSFAKWLSRGNGRAEWRLGWYDEDCDPPRDAVEQLEQEAGSKAYKTFLAVKRRSDLRVGVFTLGFRVSKAAKGKLTISGLHWWAPETRVTTDDKEWQTYPYIWFARRFLPKGERGPFDCRAPRFRASLVAAIQEMGGVEWLADVDPKPSTGFIDRLAHHYDAETVKSAKMSRR